MNIFMFIRLYTACFVLNPGQFSLVLDLNLTTQGGVSSPTLSLNPKSGVGAAVAGEGLQGIATPSANPPSDTEHEEAAHEGKVGADDNKIMARHQGLLRNCMEQQLMLSEIIMLMIKSNV